MCDLILGRRRAALNFLLQIVINGGGGVYSSEAAAEAIRSPLPVNKSDLNIQLFTFQTTIDPDILPAVKFSFPDTIRSFCFKDKWRLRTMIKRRTTEEEPIGR